MNGEFLGALDQIASEKGIDKEVLVDAIEAALLSAYKKNFGTSQNVQVNIDKSTGVVKVYAMKTIVEEVEDKSQQIYLEDAQRIDPVYELGDVVKIEVTPKNFGRIAAQNAKQVVVQRIREAERALIYQKFVEKEDEIMTCVIQRAERRNIFVDIDGAEATMPPNEQVINENYQVNDRLIVYITEVKMTNKGPLFCILNRPIHNLILQLWATQSLEQFFQCFF